MKTLTVICPVYNEEDIIDNFYGELHKVLEDLKNRYTSNILFVVDRCSDGTLGLLKEIASADRSVQIIALSSRFGHQMSLVAGIDNTESDIILMMDSDLQHPPSLIPKMLSMYEKGYDIVYTVREDSPHIGFFKRTSSKLFYRIINLISEVPIREGGADFRLISQRVAEVFRKQIRERNQFLRVLFSWVGFNSIGVPYQVGKRPAGRSKYSVGRLFRFGMQGIFSFSKRPLQAAIFLGFCFAAFGLVFAFLTLLQYFIHETLPSGWTTLTILISLFSGVQLIFLGIIGEYIGAIFDEVKRRPHYLIDEKINFDNP